jgi:dTDP-4-amino-4,6-dideoxygalactose transaminase
MGLGFAGNPEDCPITQDVSDRLVRIPFYNGLTEDDQARVVEAITSFDVT